MPALLKLSRSIENFRDALSSQPPTYDKKKNYVYKRVVGKGTFGKVLHAIWNDPTHLRVHDRSSSLDHLHPHQHQHPTSPSTRPHHKSTTKGQGPKPPKPKQDVALKVVKKSFLKRGDKNVVLFEVDILKRLNHTNVLRFYEFFESCRNYYISFEYAAGGELYERIKQRGGRYTEVDAKQCVRSILHGVEYLHSIGIIHHDLKPENILFRTKAPNSEVVLADFGAARHVESPDSLVFCDTGTYDYSPPEIFTREGHGLKLDMWAVGIITHAILSGTLPFPNHSLSTLRTAILRCELDFEGRVWREDVSGVGKAFVRGLVCVDQGERMSAEEALRHAWIVGGGEGEGEVKVEKREREMEDEEDEKLRKAENESTAVAATITTPSTTTTQSSSTSTDLPTLPVLPIQPVLSNLPILQDNPTPTTNTNTNSSRNNSRQLARARWRIAIDSAISMNRFRVCEARKSRSRSQSRSRSKSQSRIRSRSRGLDVLEDDSQIWEYDVDAGFGNNMNMCPCPSQSQISLAMLTEGHGTSTDFSATATAIASMTSLSLTSSFPRSRSRSEANSPEKLRKLERLVSSGGLGGVKSASGGDLQTSAQSSLSNSVTPPTTTPQSDRSSPPSRNLQNRIYATLRPPSRSRSRGGWLSSNNSTGTGSSRSSSSASGSSASDSSGGSEGSEGSTSSGSSDSCNSTRSTTSSIVSSNVSHSTGATSVHTPDGWCSPSQSAEGRCG